MVASKVHIFEVGAGKRTVRQLLDFGIKGQSQPAAHIRVGEATLTERLNRRIALEPRNRKARTVLECIGTD